MIMSGSRAVGSVSVVDITGFRIVGNNAGHIGIMNPGIGSVKPFSLIVREDRGAGLTARAAAVLR
jgi:hypothetical protein